MTGETTVAQYIEEISRLKAEVFRLKAELSEEQRENARYVKALSDALGLPTAPPADYRG